MKKFFSIILAFVVFSVVGLFIKSYWIPAKYAIKEQDFYKYEPYIIVQESHYTGTGWVQVGDESGYFASDDYVDIELVNDNLLPLMDMYNDDFANKFLCKVEYIGKVQHVAFEDEVDLFRIVEWYPVYPVLRDTILPAWMFSKNFMTKEEVESIVISRNEISELYKHYQYPNEDFFGKNIYGEIDYECSDFEVNVANLILNEAVVLDYSEN